MTLCVRRAGAIRSATITPRSSTTEAAAHQWGNKYVMIRPGVRTDRTLSRGKVVAQANHPPPTALSPGRWYLAPTTSEVIRTMRDRGTILWLDPRQLIEDP